MKFNGEDVELIIGDRNKIREHTLINPGTEGGGAITKIGNDNLFMGHVHLGHDCIFGDNIVVANSCAIAGHVEVDSNVDNFGALKLLLQWCQQANLAFLRCFVLAQYLRMWSEFKVSFGYLGQNTFSKQFQPCIC